MRPSFANSAASPWRLAAAREVARSSAPPANSSAGYQSVALPLTVLDGVSSCRIYELLALNPSPQSVYKRELGRQVVMGKPNLVPEMSRKNEGG